MIRLKMFISLLALSSIITQSCTKDGADTQLPDSNAIKIKTTINDVVESRTTTDGATTSWGDGDQIKMYASKDTDQPAEMPGIAYTHNGGVWSPSNQALFHKWESNFMNIGAHYPAIAGASLTSFVIPADQTTSPKHQQADWLVADVLQHTKNDGHTADLSFNHKLAKVTVRIANYRDEIGTLPASIVSATIEQNISVDAAVQLSEGTAIKMFCQTDPAEGRNHTMTAIVAPVAPKAGENWITITLEGLDFFSVKAPNNFTVEPGKHYTFDLSVGKDKITLSNITIVDWVTVDFGSGNLETVPFNDPIFVDYLVAKHGITLVNGIIDPTDAATLEKLKTITVIAVVSKDIKSLKGVEYMTALTDLRCYYNELSTLDVSKNTALTDLQCLFNELLTLDVSKNTALTNLECRNNELSTLDVSKNTALTGLSCMSNKLSTLNVSANTALTDLECGSNALSTLDISKNTALTGLSCKSNKLSTLNVSANTALTGLNCSNNQLTTLDVSANTALTELICYENTLLTLDVSANTALTNLNCYNNQLSTLDARANTALTNLICYKNKLLTLDVSANTALTNLICYNNQLSTLYASANTALTNLNCYNNQLSTLDVSANTALTNLNCSHNQLSTLDARANTALTNLDCSHNKLLTLDVRANTALTALYCTYNQLTTLDVSRNTALMHLFCSQKLDIASKNLLATLIYSVKPEGALWDVPKETTQTQVPPPAVK